MKEDLIISVTDLHKHMVNRQWLVHYEPEFNSNNHTVTRATIHHVLAEVPSEVVKQLESIGDVKKSLLLCPGCGPSWYYHYVGNEEAAKYAVEIKYVNRPNDPLEF